jgi:NDP-sugar pyrophosphorylase family protein
MKAMILAAGLGTRLQPLTSSMPKALLQAGPYTLIEFAIKKLAKHGFDDIIINVHHFADMVTTYLEKNDYFGCRISFSDESSSLLDTGGAIRQAAPFFDDGLPFIVWNADIISNIDLTRLYYYHLSSGNMATLVVRRRESTRYLLFDEMMQLTEWQDIMKGLKKTVKPSKNPPQPFAFSGIHVINPSLLKLLPNQQVFSIIDSYLEIGKTNRIGAFVDESLLFADAGKPATLTEAGRIASDIIL